MLKIKNLKLGFSDAENYKRRENKELLNHLFIRNEALAKLCTPSTTFLVGDKGTGKTAYAIYMSNNSYKNNIASIRYIRETEYQKFITLKKEKHLDLSDYSSIWKVIVFILLSEQIYEREGGKSFFKKFTKFQALYDAIQEYYLHAFSPEIQHALQFVQESKLAAEIMSKHAKAAGEQSESVTFTESRFQTNLLYIQKNFENALSSLKLKTNHLLFIDGIDIRPSTIPYDEYLDCIRGLANAVWELNNDFFPSIKDSEGRMRTVLLVRPDIFASLGLQNQNTKIRDNSVLLDWSTTYRDYRSSDLFCLTDQLLRHQQENKNTLKLGEAWDLYFPYDTPNLMVLYEKDSSFINFLRFALYRPRDIITMLSILQERFVKTSNDESRAFTQNDFNDSTFKRHYADYLLGEVKDQLSFYYSDLDYESFLKFFEFLHGKNKFSYSEYLEAFNEHASYTESTTSSLPRFMSSPEDFLQFLYNLNVISYIEETENGKYHIHWCFKDRTYSNIAPKVKTDKIYEIFYGLSKALNTGTKFKRS
ncbi:MAG: funZ protein [Kangiellaceae bacterium]